MTTPPPRPGPTGTIQLPPRRDEIQPPSEPFATITAQDIDTEPGIGRTRETWKQEAQRLRQERDAALQERDELTRTGSTPPPTRRQKAVRLGLSTAQYTALASVVAVLIPVLAKKWPLYAELITAVALGLGLQ